MKRKRVLRVMKADSQLAVGTPGDRMTVQWGGEDRASPYGQLAFFAELLQVSGLFDAWAEDCPLCYVSPNAPGKRDVPGNSLLSILAGHRLYAHITGLRCASVSPQLLGLS